MVAHTHKWLAVGAAGAMLVILLCVLKTKLWGLPFRYGSTSTVLELGRGIDVGSIGERDLANGALCPQARMGLRIVGPPEAATRAIFST